jgi:hypothetical protein
MFCDCLKLNSEFNPTIQILLLEIFVNLDNIKGFQCPSINIVMKRVKSTIYCDSLSNDVEESPIAFLCTSQPLKYYSPSSKRQPIP